jgi:hypothetical protein
MKNEELLNEIRGIFESFDKDLDVLSTDVAFVKGIIAEMQRHNGKVIKDLAKVIEALTIAITGLLGVIAWLVKR